jgi:hypothetical protein
MLSKKIVDSLKERYKDLHPLIVHRSVEHSKKDVELFDILHSFPNKYPIIWSEKKNCWVNSKRLF